MVKEFLPCIDDIKRALEFAAKEKAEKSVLEGLQLIEKNMHKALTDLGVKEIDCSENFDPAFHEALMQVDSKDHQEGQIVQVFELGYTLKDMMIRHAKVSVAK